MVSRSDYYYSNGGEGLEEEKPSSFAAVRNFIGVLIVLAIAALIAITVLKYRHPDIFFKLAVTVDIFNIKGDSKVERMRIDNITLLPISREKQELLINKTIFMGASTKMVELALGKPRNESEGYNNNNVIEKRWQYHFAGDAEPVIMVFIDNRLTGAQRIPVNEQF